MGEYIEAVGMWGPRCTLCEQPWPCRAALSERLAAVTAALTRQAVIQVSHRSGDNDRGMCCFECGAQWSISLGKDQPSLHDPTCILAAGQPAPAATTAEGA